MCYTDRLVRHFLMTLTVMKKTFKKFQANIFRTRHLEKVYSIGFLKGSLQIMKTGYQDSVN